MRLVFVPDAFFLAKNLKYLNFATRPGNRIARSENGIRKNSIKTWWKCFVFFYEILRPKKENNLAYFDNKNVNSFCSHHHVKSNYSCILVGSHVWSTGARTHRWRHYYIFPSVFSNGRKFLDQYFTYIFQNHVQAGSRYEKQEEEEKNASFKEKAGKNTREVSVEQD